MLWHQFLRLYADHKAMADNNYATPFQGVRWVVWFYFISTISFFFYSYLTVFTCVLNSLCLSSWNNIAVLVKTPMYICSYIYIYIYTRLYVHFQLYIYNAVFISGIITWKKLQKHKGIYIYIHSPHIYCEEIFHIFLHNTNIYIYVCI